MIKRSFLASLWLLPVGFLLAAPALAVQPTGAYYLQDRPLTLEAAVLASRVAQVVSLENLRRAEGNLPSLAGKPVVLSSRAAYDGPTELGPSPSTPWISMGGPALHAGEDFLLPEPQLARYNQDIRVYHFIGGKLREVQPFREFAVSRLEGEDILLTRIFFSADPREADIWRTKRYERLSGKHGNENPHVAKAYAHLTGRPIHFGVGGLWAPVMDKPRVEVKVPKRLLEDLARRGLVEIGLTGPASIPAEIIVLEQAWPELFLLPIRFVESQAP